MPAVYDAAHLGEGIPAAGRVPILRAQEGSPALTQALERRNIGFDDVATYRTVYDNPRSEELRAVVESGTVGIVTFTSASTVTGFVSALGEDTDCSAITAACIGKQTEAQAHKYNLHTITAEHATMDALIQRIVEGDSSWN